MRMAELSARSGVPIPTIRFYMREGLVPPGELTSPNQASYDDSHVRALKLARTLVEVGGLSIARVRAVQEHIRAKDSELMGTLGSVQYGLTPEREPVEDETYRRAEQRVEELLGDRGWTIRERNPARRTLADTLATLTRLGYGELVDRLDEYASTAEQLAEREVPELLARGTAESVAEGVIAYDVLGDAMLSSLRRLAQEAVAAPLLEDGPGRG